MKFKAFEININEIQKEEYILTELKRLRYEIRSRAYDNNKIFCFEEGYCLIVCSKPNWGFNQCKILH